eukprot:5061634-Prymnesium_polylepis.1
MWARGACERPFAHCAHGLCAAMHCGVRGLCAIFMGCLCGVHGHSSRAVHGVHGGCAWRSRG